MRKKNHVIRKFSLFFMILCMMISLMPVTFFAEPAEQETVEVEETPAVKEIPLDAIHISTLEDLMALAENCQRNTWSVGKTVVLDNDMDLTGQGFGGIPTFGGTFLGQGYTMKGLELTKEGSIVGLFRYLQKTAVVDGLHLEGVVQPEGSKSVAGAFAGRNAGVIQNCSFSGNVSGNEQIGGLVGINETTGLIENCTITGMVYGNHFVGGAVGENHGVVRNTENHAEINTLSVQNSVALEDITMDSLLHTESAGTTTDIGGLAGSNSGVLRNCTNRGAVGYQHMGYNIGGIVGTQSGFVADCVNYAEIQGRKEVGGIVGHMEPNMVLDYDTDSLQILSGQMDALGKTVNRIERDVENGSNSIQSQVDGLQSDVNNVENALNALSGSLNIDVSQNFGTMDDLGNLDAGAIDPDRVTAAASDLSSTLSNAMDSVYATSQGISSSMGEMSSNVMAEMEVMASQLEDVMMTMNNIESDLGFQIYDISDADTEEDTVGKAAGCTNYGNISGDLNVGGIAGMMAQENDLDEDAEILGDMSLNATYEVRVVIRDCKNFGTIETGKQCAGGIVGQMTMGVVLDSMNFGNLDALHASYVGGIAGDSDTIIRNCGAKSVIAGDSYVGGIAGKGNEVTGCYAFVDIKAYTEKAGAILGDAKELPGKEEHVIAENRYFILDTAVGGVDGIVYENATEPLPLGEFLRIEELDESFLASNVIFKAEGQEDIIKTVPVGESLALDEIPVFSVEEGEEYDWELVPAVTYEVLGMGEVADIEYISEEALTNILFDQTYEVSFDTKGSVVSSTEETEKGLSILLAVGSFAKNTKLELTNQLSIEAVVNGKEAIVNYQVALSNPGVEKLHFYLPENADGEAVKLLVKDASGNWAEREFVIDGRYMAFTFTAEDAGFALLEDAGAMIGKTTVVAGIAIVLLFVIVLVGKARKKGRKKSK